MTAVFRRELGSFFGSFLGYIFTFLFLIFAGIVTMTLCIQASYAQYEYVISSLCLVYIVAIPLLTMRSISEERKQKTEILLYSLPVSMTRVVLGKFFAMAAALLVPLAIICVYPVVLSAYGHVNFAAAYSGILAFYLLGLTLTSIGMFISSFTENQALSAGITFILILLDYFLPDLVTYFPPVISNVVAYLCLFSHYDSFYDQIFDVQAIVCYVSITAVFVFLTIQSLERRRWN